MNKLILLLSLSLIHPLKAQKWDAQWLIGQDETIQHTGGGTLLDFSNGKLLTSFAPKRFFSDCANTSICDRYGNLQFYTNGCFILNKTHEVIDNGEIHDGNYTDSFCADSSLDYANRVPQCILALPIFGYDSLYYVISKRLDDVTVNGTTTIIATKLFLNKVDMRQHGGLGKVTQKDLEILTDSLESENLQAIPHANGRDWWIIAPKFMSNCYFVILLEASGHSSVTEQCLGTSFGLDSWLGQAAFSPDGNKYARFHWKYNLNIFDFDRCSGAFTNPLVITFPDISFARAGCAFSRSSRYLYATTHTKLFQFDMQAPDIAASRTHIADYDGFNSPYATKFYMANLALDGKIYIGCPGQHKHIHVINEPEQPGTACDFRQHAIPLLTSNFWSFPNQAHTRLGPVDGTACDSLGINNNPWAFFRWEQKDSLQPLQVSFVDLSAYQPDTWHWDFGDGAQSQLANPEHTYTASGAYQVCLTVSNPYHADTFCQVLYLGVSATGSPIKESRITLAPNPFQEYFILNNPQQQIGAFRLYDQMGKLVCEKQLAFSDLEIYAGNLPIGMYYWEVTGNGGRLQAGKIMKLLRRTF